MLKKQSLEFLKDLERNNDKEWFNNHKDEYAEFKDDMIRLAKELINEIAKFDLSIKRSDPDPSKCVSRIYRDIRFSKDKTPYKTDIYILISAGGKYDNTAFYYFQAGPKGCTAGGGIYKVQPAALKKIRQEIEHSFDEWQKMIENDRFKTTFPHGIIAPDELKTVPAGFDKDSPALKY